MCKQSPECLFGTQLLGSKQIEQARRFFKGWSVWARDDVGDSVVFSLTAYKDRKVHSGHLGENL